MSKIISLLFLAATCVACTVPDHVPPPESAVVVYAITETDPVNSRDDAADDPAIWVHPSDPKLSRIIGTDKKAGIEVYSLDGSRLQTISAGRTNNVDLRMVTEVDNWSALVVASNRSFNTLSLFLVDNSGELTWLRDSEVNTGLTEPYGLCMYQSEVGMQVFVNDTDGRYQQWLLTPQWQSNNALPKVTASLLREFAVSSQPEGCVADDENQRLFVGVEDEGIRTVSARHDDNAEMQVIANIDGEILVSDVEGMSLYFEGAGGYLIVSSQGNYSYAVYDRLPPHQYRGSFVVKGSLQSAIDGTEETDGLDANSLLRAGQYPEGILVVQDGYNTLPPRSQNFKYISWRDVRSKLSLQ